MNNLEFSQNGVHNRWLLEGHDTVLLEIKSPKHGVHVATVESRLVLSAMRFIWDITKEDGKWFAFTTMHKKVVTLQELVAATKEVRHRTSDTLDCRLANLEIL